MCKIGKQPSLEGPASYAQGYLYGFPPYLNCILLRRGAVRHANQKGPIQGNSDAPLRPFLMCASSDATKSENIESTLSKPVRMDMISELRLVYRFDSIPRRNTFNV